jgi:tetratricopeptide (TPR) repeat protein
VKQDQAEETLRRLLPALLAGKAGLEHWLSCASLLEQAGAAQAARAVQGAIALARSRVSFMPPAMRLAVLGQSAAPLDLIEILIGLGDPQAALDLLQGLERFCHDCANLHFQRGTALTVLGDAGKAIASFEAAIEKEPAHADAHLRLGYLLSEQGQIAKGFEHFMARARIVSGHAHDAGRGAPLHKVRHDQEQREYLSSLGVPASAFHLGDGARVPGPVINPAHVEDAVLAGWKDASPQFVMIDDFLTQPALEKLRSYCLESTVWHRIYDAGYIGAIPADGFACPLLAQLAEEIIARWPRIIGPHKFKYLGAFKYDSELSRGTNTHADLAAVNVNFYITPDDANLDPASGGMAVWNSTIDSEPLMRQLNGSDTAMRAYLSSRNAVVTTIAHRSNRAVIFKSSLVHKTDDCAFKTGYANKRINVSLLFGDYGASTRV